MKGNTTFKCVIPLYWVNVRAYPAESCWLAFHLWKKIKRHLRETAIHCIQYTCFLVQHMSQLPTVCLQALSDYVGRPDKFSSSVIIPVSDLDLTHFLIHPVWLNSLWSSYKSQQRRRMWQYERMERDVLCFRWEEKVLPQKQDAKEKE